MSIKPLFLYIIILLIPFSSFGKKKNKGALTDSTYIIINNIYIGGNKKTKKKIILRELLFHPGDTINLKQLNFLITESKENLTNTSLFNYITINTIDEQDDYISIYIILEERWYLWPYLIFEQADRNLSAFLHNKEWDRINYGVMLVKNNFRGMGETVKFKVRLGYKEQFEIAYKIPYLGNSHKHGLSTEFSWFRQHEIPYNTQQDQLVFYKDENDYVSKKLNSRISYHFRNKHDIHHTFSANYTYVDVNDTVILLNSNYFDKTISETQYLSLSYNFKLDKRNYIYYPLKGYNFEFMFSQKGLNLLPNEMKGIWKIETQAYYYLNFQDRWYTGAGASGKISSNYKQPYFTEKALGYSTYLRSFEYNVIDGQSFITGRSFIKYAIIPTQIKYIEYLKWSKFNKVHYSLYINTFVDAGYVHDVNPYFTNLLPNTFLASTGVGVDLVAYYDFIMRLEYSINIFKEHGFFIHIGKAF